MSIKRKFPPKSSKYPRPIWSHRKERTGVVWPYHHRLLFVFFLVPKWRFNWFYWVLLGFTGFYWVLLVFYCFLLVFTGFYWVLLVFSGFYWVLLGFTGFYWVLLVFTGFYWVLLGFTGFYWVLLGFTGFYSYEFHYGVHQTKMAAEIVETAFPYKKNPDHQLVRARNSVKKWR